MNRLILTSTCVAALMALSLSATAQTLPQAAAVAQSSGVSAPTTSEPSANPIVPAAPVAGSAPTESLGQPSAPPSAPATLAPPPEVAPTAPAQQSDPASAAPAPAVTGPTITAPEISAPMVTAPAATAPEDTAIPPAEQSDPSSAITPTAAEDMPPTATAPEVSAPSSLPKAHDMTPLGMYNQADVVVKTVMILLAAASFVTWTIWLFKLVETFVARRRARLAARTLGAARSLEEAIRTLAQRRDPAAFMAQAVYAEFQRSDAAIDPAGPEGVKERAVSLVHRVEVQATARMRRGMGILATVGAVSPFVGLLGTVWGIMNSFIGIAETQTTNLAVVAPGIAEALFATAIGLVAAIPAVVIYNGFTRSIAAYKQSLGDAGAAALRLLSRDIDFRHVKGR